MTSTERLRALLDERGVEWYESVTRPGLTWVYRNGKVIRFHAWQPDTLKVSMFDLTPEQAIAATLGPKVTGETSDGYHTFNELYHHRAVLFSVIVRDHPDLAWKSKLHSDGTMYDGMFIVGIETPDGQATYHYDIAPYWEMFDCKELERAPEWDGHTPEQAIARIATLGDTDATEERQADAGMCHMEQTGHVKVAGVDYYDDDYECSECGAELFEGYNYCPNCGRHIVEVDE